LLGWHDAGSDERSGSLFSYVGLEARVRADHPLRVIRDLANAALGDLSGEFGKLYRDFGRPSIAPEKLLRAIQANSIQSVTIVSMSDDRRTDSNSYFFSARHDSTDCRA
jgi:transposase